jgi:hypothetical protein
MLETILDLSSDPAAAWLQIAGHSTKVVVASIATVASTLVIANAASAKATGIVDSVGVIITEYSTIAGISA